MKKIFILSTLFAGLASCTLGSTSTDYTSLYNANIKAQIAEGVANFNTVYGVTQEAKGNFSSIINLIDLNTNTPASIQLNSEYEATTNGFNSEFALKSPKMTVTNTVENGEEKTEVSADSVTIFSGLTSSLAKVVNPNFSSNAPEENQAEMKNMLEKFKEFDGKWIDLQDMSNLPQESKNALAKLSTLTAQDVENYLTTYHIFTATGTVTQDGSKYTFPVEFNVGNTINLLDKINTDFTGTGLTAEQKTELETALKENVKFETATLAFDSKNPLHSEAKFVIINPTDDTQKISIDSKYWDKTFNFSGKLTMTGKDLGVLTINSTGDAKNGTTTISLAVDAGSGTMQEIASLNANVEDSILKTMSGSITAGIAGGNLQYTHKDSFSLSASTLGQEIFHMSNKFTGENFEGKATFQGKEVATWKAEVANKVLTSLALLVQDVTAHEPTDLPLINLNLTKQEGTDMTLGIVQLAKDGQNIGSAKVGLEVVGSEKFGLTVNEIKAEGLDVVPLQKFEFFSTQKGSKSDKKLSIPTADVNLSQVQEKMGVSNFSPVDYTQGLEPQLDVDALNDDMMLDVTDPTVAPMYPTEPLDNVQ